MAAAPVTLLRNAAARVPVLGHREDGKNRVLAHGRQLRQCRSRAEEKGVEGEHRALHRIQGVQICILRTTRRVDRTIQFPSRLPWQGRFVSGYALANLVLFSHSSRRWSDRTSADGEAISNTVRLSWLGDAHSTRASCVDPL